MFGRDFQVTADVVRYQFFHVRRAFHRQVVAQARTDGNFFHPINGAGLTIEFDQWAMVGAQVYANVGIHTRQAAADGLDLIVFAGQSIHVRRRPAQIRNLSRETFDLIANVFDFLQDRFFGPVLDHAPFVFGDGTERTPAKAAAHDIHGKLDHLPRRDAGPIVDRMGRTGIGQAIDAIHFRCAQRHGWRRQPNIAVAVALNQSARVGRIAFLVKYAGRLGIEHRVFAHGFKAWQAHHGFGVIQAPVRVLQIQLRHVDFAEVFGRTVGHVGCTAHILHVFGGFTCRYAVCNVNNGAFSIAVQQ